MARKSKILTKSSDQIAFERFLKENELRPSRNQRKRLWQEFRSKEALKRIRSDPRLLKKLSEYDIRDIGNIIKKNSTSQAVLKINDVFFRLTNTDIAKIFSVGERRIYEIYQDEESKERCLNYKEDHMLLSNGDSGIEAQLLDNESVLEKPSSCKIDPLTKHAKKGMWVKKYRPLPPDIEAKYAYTLMRIQLCRLNTVYPPNERNNENQQYIELRNKILMEFLCPTRLFEESYYEYVEEGDENLI